MTVAIVIAAITHVVVDNMARIVPPERGPFGWNEPTWVAAGAVAAIIAGAATALMAIFTWQLALRTRKLAEETGTLAAETRDLVKASAGQIEQAERHHQEGLMPIIFVRIDCSTHVTVVQNWGTGNDAPQPALALRIQGEIVNVGPGPATDVEMIFKPAPIVGRRLYIGIIGPNSIQPLDHEWTISAGSPSPFVPYECLTRYRSVFGNEGATFQRSHSGYAKDARVENHIKPGPNGQAAVDNEISVRGLTGILPF